MSKYTIRLTVAPIDPSRSTICPDSTVDEDDKERIIHSHMLKGWSATTDENGIITLSKGDYDHICTITPIA